MFLAKTVKTDTKHNVCILLNILPKYGLKFWILQRVATHYKVKISTRIILLRVKTKSNVKRMFNTKSNL